MNIAFRRLSCNSTPKADLAFTCPDTSLAAANLLAGGLK
jgi:hypothetical protein